MVGRTITNSPSGDPVEFSNQGAATFTLRTTPNGTRFLITNWLVGVDAGNGGNVTIQLQVNGVIISRLFVNMVVNTPLVISTPINSLHIGDGVEIIRVLLSIPAGANVSSVINGFDS